MFYGWYIVGASVLMSAVIGGVGFYGFTALVDPLVATFGWSYAQISFARTIRGLQGGIMNPLMGMVVDCWS